MFGISLSWWQTEKPGKVLIQGLAHSPDGEDAVLIHQTSVAEGELLPP